MNAENNDPNRLAPPLSDAARGWAAPVRSKRRSLRKYYTVISDGLANGRDGDLARRALDDLIGDNESAIIEEEAQPNAAMSEVADKKRPN